MKRTKVKPILFAVALLLALAVLVTSFLLLEKRRREKADALAAAAEGLIGLPPPLSGEPEGGYGTESALELLKEGIGFHLFFFSDTLFNVRTESTATLITKGIEADYGVYLGASLKVDYELFPSPTEQKERFLRAVSEGDVDAYATRLYVISFGDTAVLDRIQSRGEDQDGDGEGDLLYSATGTLEGDLKDLIGTLRTVSPSATILLIVQGEEEEERASAMLALAEETGALALDMRPPTEEAKRQNPTTLYATQTKQPTAAARALYPPAVRALLASAVQH